MECGASLPHRVEKALRDAVHIAKDSDLDSLRGREDFKTLIAKLKNTPPAELRKQP